MKKMLVWVFIALAVVVIAVSVFKNQGNQKVTSRVDLDRPLIVGLSSWPGYTPGIVANGGFKEKCGKYFYQKVRPPCPVCAH